MDLHDHKAGDETENLMVNLSRPHKQGKAETQKLEPPCTVV